MRSIVKHIRQSLSWKLSLGILLMAIPIFMLALGILFVQSRNTVKREATKHAASVVNTTLQSITRYMNIVRTATDLTAWDVIANLHPDSILTYSNYVVALNGHIDGCSISLEPDIFPKYGRYFSVYTVRDSDTVRTVIEEEYEYFEKVWYKQSKQKGEACWAVYYDEGDSLELTIDGMIASYSKPLYRADKSFVGIISTDLSLLRLSKDLTAETPYDGSYFFMTGDEGRYYLHPDTTQLFAKTIFSDAAPDKNADIFALGHQMTTGQQGSMSVRINGEPCIVSYQPVPGTNWSLALVCPERTILHSYNLLAYIVSALLIVGLLLILLFSSFTVAHAILPLYNLAGKLQRIAERLRDNSPLSTIHSSLDDSSPIPHSRHQDVVGRLQNSFAVMQESLNQHMGDIQQTNAEALRRNEELVRASELAKESNRQKSLFIQHVSHQVRTPLNIIMGFSQVLKESKDLMPEEEKKSITDMIRHNALMLYRMVLMLFDSSARGTTEELYANRNDEVLCNDLVRESIAETIDQFPQQSIRFSTDVPDDFLIHSNYTYLKHSFRELLYNACKYSDGQHIAVRINRTQTVVRFVFEDTGPGIADEYVDHLFEMFTKVNDLSEGLGLGLSLAKRHLKNLGGDIILDTSYKAGCRFIVELPVD